MSRRRRPVKREIIPDPKYNSDMVSLFVNGIMRRGKKSIAEKIFYGAIDDIVNRTKQDGVAIFKKALANVKPSVEVRSRRIGGANYQIPREVRPERKFFLATHWIIKAAQSKKGKPMAEKLAEELILASKNEGSAIKKKLDTHRMAEANRAFAHYRW